MVHALVSSNRLRIGFNVDEYPLGALTVTVALGLVAAVALIVEEVLVPVDCSLVPLAILLLLQLALVVLVVVRV